MMRVTIDLDAPRLRIHLTAKLTTLVAHTDGVPYRVEVYETTDFIAKLKARRSRHTTDPTDA